MSAEGYKSSPLSDEMERRIRERLVFERNEVLSNAKMDRPHLSAFATSRVSALEWVLNEADVLKLEKPEVRQPQTYGAEKSRFAAVAEWCHDCGHVHADDSECGFPVGGGRICRCERQAPA